MTPIDPASPPLPVAGRRAMTDVKMRDFRADIIADSINPGRNRITTFLLTYPRFIHSELMTHRAFSRNSASSRAIPVEKMIGAVIEVPATPIRWGKAGKGMQDAGKWTGSDAVGCSIAWEDARDRAVESAHDLLNTGLAKQIVNRVLEPFCWMTTLVTATEYQNFFSLRVHKDAQPEFQHLAHMMLRRYVENEPSPKRWGEWHLPFEHINVGASDEDQIKIAVARAARTSYLTIEGKIDPAQDIALYNRLLASGHLSPFEHPACANPDRHGNFEGWRSHRMDIPGQDRRCDLRALLEDYERETETTRV